MRLAQGHRFRQYGVGSNRMRRRGEGRGLNEPGLRPQCDCRYDGYLGQHGYLEFPLLRWFSLTSLTLALEPRTSSCQRRFSELLGEVAVQEKTPSGLIMRGGEVKEPIDPLFGVTLDLPCVPAVIRERGPLQDGPPDVVCVSNNDKLDSFRDDQTNVHLI